MIKEVYYVCETSQTDYDIFIQGIYKDCIFTDKNKAYKLCQQLEKDNTEQYVEYEVCSLWVDRLMVD